MVALVKPLPKLTIREGSSTKMRANGDPVHLLHVVLHSSELLAQLIRRHTRGVGEFWELFVGGNACQKAGAKASDASSQSQPKSETLIRSGLG
ncbi:hypothetical protein ZHAS_00010239 [Anopheles sinensis]|uniref:Uncharacterized protein n=1 Tax=Anopheles sinensis TaxID=74873 RepID=A0A084VX36_ANOSI|nr:hypothetical protein ZHAS_00010239 [Anopheles sinensis]